MTMGDRIVVMKDGNVQQIDSPLNLYNHPKNKFVAGFIGSPAMNFMPGRIARESGLFLHEGQNRLRIPAQFENNLAAYVDRNAVFGIRPEDIHLAENANNLTQTAELSATVEVVEPMGSEIYLYLNTGTNNLVARINARSEPAVGSRLALVLDMSKAHFFDAQSEARLNAAV